MRAWILLCLLACCGLSGALSAATVEVRLSNFRFTPNDITIDVGDTVRFMNTEGIHDVRADDGSYGNTPSGPGWVFSRTYTAPGEYRVYCSPHSFPGADINSNMNARITVRGSGFSIVQGLNGAWFDPNNPGQGFLFDFQTSNSFMFGAWFTYETAGNLALKVGSPSHRWLTMQGNYSGDTVNLQVFNTSGGVFNTPATTTTTQVGTATLRFSSCTQATLNFTLTQPAITGVIQLQKGLAPFGSGCTSEPPQADDAAP